MALVLLLLHMLHVFLWNMKRSQRGGSALYTREDKFDCARVAAEAAQSLRESIRIGALFDARR